MPTWDGIATQSAKYHELTSEDTLETLNGYLGDQVSYWNPTVGEDGKFHLDSEWDEHLILGPGDYIIGVSGGISGIPTPAALMGSNYYKLT